MARSPLTGTLQRLFAAHHEAAVRGIPVDDVLEQARKRDEAARRATTLRREAEAELRADPSRRDLLRYTGAADAAIVAAQAATRAEPARGATAPRIAIVGAGLAGVRAAHLLWTGNNPKAPLASTVYEADTTHIGGRCWSLRGFFDNGIVGEHGGAFINSNQKKTLDLGGVETGERVANEILGQV